MRRASVFALAVGSSIACAMACSPPESEPFHLEVRRNPPRSAQGSNESSKEHTHDERDAGSSTPSPDPEEKKKLGAKCTSDSECADGACVDIEGLSLCAKACEDDEDCAIGKCIELDDDRAICGPP